MPPVLAAFYGYLACHAYASEKQPSAATDYIGNPRGQFFLRRDTMAEEFGCSERSVDGYVTKLIAAGYLQQVTRYRDNGLRRSSLYRLRLDLDEPFADDEFSRAATRKKLRATERKNLRASNRVLKEEQGSSIASRLPRFQPGNEQNAEQSVASSIGTDANARKKLATVSDRFRSGSTLERTDIPALLPSEWMPNRAHWRELHNAWDRGVPIEADAVCRGFEDMVTMGTPTGQDWRACSWGEVLLWAIRAIVADLEGDCLDVDVTTGYSHAYRFHPDYGDNYDDLLNAYHSHATRTAA